MRNQLLMTVVFIFMNFNMVLADTKEINLDSPEAKTSYSVGYQVGGDFKRQKIKMDEATFIQGIRDSLAENKPAMTEQEMQTTLVELKKKIIEQQQQDGIEVAKINQEKGQSYLAENKMKEGVETLPSGLQYRVITAGAGKSPGESDNVTVHYTGTLIDGTVFDSSHNRGKPAEFQVNQVIKGWIEALQLMKTGSKWTLTIPSELAYGPRGAGQKIPPNSVLLFEVELLSINNKEDKKAAK